MHKPKKNKTIKLRDELKAIIRSPKYHMFDFWEVCPWPPDELLHEGRIHEAKMWRQIGMSWQVLCGSTLAAAGSAFGRDHATVLHAMKVLVENLRSQHYPEYVAAVDLVRGRASERGIVNARDSFVEAAFRLERALYKAMPYVFREEEFHCRSMYAEKLLRFPNPKRCKNQCTDCFIEQRQNVKIC